MSEAALYAVGGLLDGGGNEGGLGVEGDDRLRVGTTRAEDANDTFPESFITKYTAIRR
jgi:hypothetical protein